ncbi:YeiH family protein [Sulfuriroseicoccus oceanibius]|uniref:Putative sulfate exporter family transporter n=1 Tax=Sulfuriroseicoccus oceanibius TaxID=2707525 RepID=A0A6B3L7A9_9BACT|nr:putative sulfate exporter family transporter [Sulfuriroseicoccus oceanibius]QQL43973.1 putative sulfate exporter family transporter [Sulfuriroseicoccus oceanibius]
MKIVSSLKSVGPGLALVVAIASAAWLMAPVVPVFDRVTLALVIGAAVRGVWGASGRCELGIRIGERQMLSAAIVLMGCQFGAGAISEIGQVLPTVIATIGVTLLAALLIGRWFGLSLRFSLLLGAGNAICGASAIAGVAPGLHADEREIGVAVGVVNLLGTVGMLAVPVLALKCGFGAEESACLIGGSLQAIGQAVAAGYSLGESVGELSTVVKMLRVSLLLPVALLLPLVLRIGDSGSSVGGRRVRGWRSVPWYLVGFVLCAVMASSGAVDSVTDVLGKFAKPALVIAMAAIGLRIDPRVLLRQAPRALVVGALVNGVQIAFLISMLSY